MNLTPAKLDAVIAAAHTDRRKREVLRHFRPDGSGIKIAGENVPAWIILTVTRPAIYRNHMNTITVTSTGTLAAPAGIFQRTIQFVRDRLHCCLPVERWHDATNIYCQCRCGKRTVLHEQPADNVDAGRWLKHES